jgi:MarR family transcriptional regulator, temperature-dependent positive regulator of motility
MTLALALEPPTSSAFDINASVVHLLHRADQRTGDTFACRLGHRDLTPRQFAVLVAVGARDGATQSLITEDTGIDRSTMVDVVRRLIKRGYLHRRRSRTDARAYVVRLTDQGRRIVDGALPEAMEVDQTILAALAPNERATFVAYLARIIDALTAETAPPAAAPLGQVISHDAPQPRARPQSGA